ncbi:MAG: pirin family protein [Cytophagales bacterium]|nr:MAG: pirin family protein [Cytophagales bacterium]TAF61315.1 MAG: pirin family protein [Cytophagales bacterium]
MDRKDFLKYGILGSGIFASGPAAASILNNNIDEIKPLEILGFNHLPTSNPQVMANIVLHKAAKRGYANHGWLESYHSFSFASYYNPEQMHFGVLRVLNDDRIAGGAGFGTHPHDNMEIVSIPLSGALEHKDSMGNVAVISKGEIQVMSAGTGISHSEKNKNTKEEAKFLQIWIIPNKRNVTPRYDQIKLNAEERVNTFQQILSPSPNDAGVWIHQDAWFHLADFEPGKSSDYQIKKSGNGVYAFVLSGTATINGIELEARDGLGVWNTDKIEVKANSQLEILLMDVPMAI